MIRSWPVAVLLLAAPAVYGAPTVGWVRASGQLDADSPARYTPLNLLDGNPATAWCSRGADALSEALSLGFAEPVTLTRLEVTTGNAASEETFRAFSRVRKLLLRGPDGTATVSLEDRLGPQTVTLEKPLKGKAFAVEVLDSYSAEDPLAPVCLADLLPFAGTTALAGPPLRKWLAYQQARADVLGLWYGGPDGSPDRTLSFFLDGTWRYQPEGPGARIKPLTGKWWTKSGQVWMTLPGRGKVEAKPRVARRSETGKGKPSLMLSLTGEVGELKQTFRDGR